MSDGLRPRRKLADAERPEVNSDRFGDISFALARTALPQRFIEIPPCQSNDVNRSA